MARHIPVPQITFRPARPQDLSVLLRLMKGYYLHDRLRYSARAAGAAARALMSRPRQGRIWLICDQGKPVGYIVLAFSFSIEYGGREGMIDELFVVSSRRGRGIGACAMAFIESVAREKGLRVLHLEVARWNRPAHRMYLRAGFRPRERYDLMTRLFPNTSRPTRRRRRTHRAR